MPSRTTQISEIQKTINKRWPGSIKRASDPSLVIERIATGMLSIDVALSGGFARGRHTEIYGAYNVGKTYVTYKTIATSQAEGLHCAFIDVEGTFDPSFAEAIGVDLEQLDFPEHGLHANRLVDIMETMLRSEEYDLIVLDSIAALLPKAEMESDMEQGSYGTHQARLMSAGLRRLTAANKRTALIYINQTRENIGVMFGPRNVTSGGRAMSFYAGTRLEMSRIENIKRPGRIIDLAKGDAKTKDVVYGHRVLVRCEKDKTGGTRPYTETTFVFNYDIGGVDPIEDLIYLGRVFGLVHKEGSSWWIEEYDDEKQRSRARFVKWLRTNIAVAEELEQSIRTAAAEGPSIQEETEQDEDE